MRIAIITYCLGYNYGAMLQAYASVKAIEGLGHSVQLVNFHQPWSFGLDGNDWRNYVGRSPKSIWKKWKTLWKQRKLYRCFSPMWTMFPLTEYYGCNSEKLKTKPPKCDCLITGSDQTWNTSSDRESFAPYFLNFGEDCIKRISYAASLGNVKFRKDDIDWIKSQLNQYDAISVREKSAVDYLSSIGISGVVQMPDPTLIVKRSIYDDLIKSENHHSYDAVLYILGDKNPRLEIKIPDVLKCNNIDLLNVLNISLANFICKGCINTPTTVPKWVDAIANAKIVITNSFHAVVFCLLFRRPFIYIKFEGKESGRNDRVFSLLNETSEAYRMVDLSKDIIIHKFLDKPEFESEINKFRETGVGFLKKVLNSD